MMCKAKGQFFWKEETKIPFNLFFKNINYILKIIKIQKKLWPYLTFWVHGLTDFCSHLKKY